MDGVCIFLKSGTGEQRKEISALEAEASREWSEVLFTLECIVIFGI
jgi:hypothetical protein